MEHAVKRHPTFPPTHTYSVYVGVRQSHIVVASNAVAESRQSLFHSLDLYTVRQGIPKMLQLLIGPVNDSKAIHTHANAHVTHK